MSIDIKDFGDTDRKLISKLSKRGAFDAILDKAVDMSRVNLEVISRWVGERLTEILGFEDEVVIGLVTNLLSQRTDAFSGQVKKLDPKALQVQLTGFLEKQAAPFVAELWTLLVDAQDSPYGIPRVFIERKKQQLAGGQAKQRTQVVAAGGVEDRRPDASERRPNDRRMDRHEDLSRPKDRRRDVDSPERRRKDRHEDSSRPKDRREDSSRQEDSSERRPKERRSRFSAPVEEPKHKRPRLPEGWEWRESRSRAGQWYCVNARTGEKRWDSPDAEKIVVRHVLVKHAESSKRPATDLSRGEARDELSKLRRRIVTADDQAREMATVAKERSDCPSGAAKGGLLAPFAKGELDQAFEAAALKLAPGELSPIVDTPSGLHLIFRVA